MNVCPTKNLTPLRTIWNAGHQPVYLPSTSLQMQDAFSVQHTWSMTSLKSSALRKFVGQEKESTDKVNVKLVLHMKLRTSKTQKLAINHIAVRMVSLRWTGHARLVQENPSQTIHEENVYALYVHISQMMVIAVKYVSKENWDPKSTQQNVNLHQIVPIIRSRTLIIVISARIVKVIWFQALMASSVFHLPK